METFEAPASPVHPRAPGVRAAHGPAAPPARGHRRRRAQPAQPARRLPLQATLPVCHADLRHRAAAPGDLAGTRLALLADARGWTARRRATARGKEAEDAAAALSIEPPPAVEPAPSAKPAKPSQVVRRGGAAAAAPAAPAHAVLGEELVRVENLVKHYDIKGGLLGNSKVGAVRALTGSRSRSRRARRWVSSASRAAARPRSARCCCGSSRPRAGRSTSTASPSSG